MAFYEAFQNPNHQHFGDFSNGNIVLVKSGFSWPAFLFAPIWLIYQRMWLVLVFYVCASIAFYLLGQHTNFFGQYEFWLNLCFALIFAFEANNLRKWSLKRRYYNSRGTTYGKNLYEAEVNYFEQHLNQYHTDNKIEPTEMHFETRKKETNKQLNSHWKTGGKRQADSVVGLFDDTQY